VGEDRPIGDLDRRTVAQAADALGVSQDAVRKRIARGTIPHHRDESGRVYVYLSPSETIHETDQDTRRDDATKTVQDVYIRSLEDQIAFLRRELERKDTILLNLTDRIPQLEAPASLQRESPETVEEAQEGAEPHSATGGMQEATESSETASEAPDRAEPRSVAVGAQEDSQRPWWRRWFGG
jgi:excisionase family DNA binding protein